MRQANALNGARLRRWGWLLAAWLTAPVLAEERPGVEADPETPTAAELFAADFEPAAKSTGYQILGQQIAAGEMKQLNWQIESAMAGLTVPTPVLVAHGLQEGPTLCLVAAIHGDELNGVEIVRRILFGLPPEKLSGTVIGIPIANSFGFLRGSRYLPDRRDLNRFFPGSADGSMASRFAAALFGEIIKRCSVVVDIHTGSFHRSNLPQLRADLRIPTVLDMSRKFGDIAVLHSTGPTGSLRRAATDIDIPALTLEAGESSRFEQHPVDEGVEAIQMLLSQQGMIERFRLFGQPQPVFYESTWVRADSGGILFSEVQLGDMVDKGARLATITDPIENGRTVLRAPFRGRVLGMAVNQVVMPGFAAFHLGRIASEQQVIEATAGEESDVGDPPAADASPEAALSNDVNAPEDASLGTRPVSDGDHADDMTDQEADAKLESEDENLR